MYTGWVKCSENFQKMAGFTYKGKQKRHGNKFKYYGCEITDIQLQGMKHNWEKFKKVDIEWDLEKAVECIYGVKDGDVLLNLLGYNHYFFSKYTNIKHLSKLKEWKTYNGLYYSSEGKYVSEIYYADRTHIRDNCTIYNTHGGYITEDTKSHEFDVEKIDMYIENLKEIKNKLIQLNES